MKFDLAADKMVMVDGTIITIKAGKFETTDKVICNALVNANGVKQIKQDRKQKKAD